MQRLTLVRYTTKSGRADENETLARGVFSELKAAAPAHVAYALFRNGDEFVHLFVNSQDEDAAMLVELPAFKAYVADIAGRCAAPPEQTRMSLELVESYGLA
jgi:quinol monooxygenase YgiN